MMCLSHLFKWLNQSPVFFFLCRKSLLSKEGRHHCYPNLVMIYSCLYICSSHHIQQWKWHCIMLTLPWGMLTLNIMLMRLHDSSERALRGMWVCENFHIKSIIRSRFFTPTSLMKNVQRHIHYFIELTECDKRRAAATEGREAALQ